MVARTDDVAIETASPDVVRLVESARRGRNVVITAEGQPIARVVAVAPSTHRPKAGSHKGLVVYMADDFDASDPVWD